ncbi:MAG: GGIII-like transmembrane region-containing protein [Candidatus Magasanikbacteria bacterium]|jgi:hypothetical protein
MNKYIKIILSISTILLGVFFIIFGGYDDSPGLQGIGLILIIVTVVIAIMSRKKNNNL